MKEAQMAVERLKKVILRDKIECYEGLTRVIRGDLFSLLSCYFGLNGDELEVTLDINDNGRYCLNCSLEAA
ncbi:MAG: hypothetical protein RR348_05300, partial [Clostridia bacterium]